MYLTRYRLYYWIVAKFTLVEWITIVSLFATFLYFLTTLDIHAHLCIMETWLREKTNLM
jgi:hypothetical protein